MKIKTITRTNLGFPSEWKGVLDDNSECLISYRYGKIKIIKDNKEILIFYKDQFDIGGYMTDEDLIDVLKNNNFYE